MTHTNKNKQTVLIFPHSKRHVMFKICLNDVKLSGTKDLSVSTTSRKVKRIRKVGVLCILMIFFLISFLSLFFRSVIFRFVYCSVSLSHSFCPPLSPYICLYLLSLSIVRSFSSLPPLSFSVIENKRYTSVPSTLIHTHTNTHLILFLLFICTVLTFNRLTVILLLSV